MSLTEGIASVYEERKDLLVLALTGRTGSGCSTAALQLSRAFHELSLTSDFNPEPENRKLAICHDYARIQWIPFKVLSVSAAIYSFLLEVAWSDIDKLLGEHKVGAAARAAVQRLHAEASSSPDSSTFVAAMDNEADASTSARAWTFFTTQLAPQLAQVRAELKNSFQPFFQSVGDNIRLSGSPTDVSIHPTRLFTLMRRVQRLVRAAESYDRQNGITSTRVAIDAIRNPLELVYLRDHFGSFYAIAITADDDVRQSRLIDAGLNKADINRLDEKEYSDSAKHLDTYKTFVSQNLKDCIQKADIFINNPGRPGEIGQYGKFLASQLVRYVALALRPGLVTPTRDERCMQIAFVAKLNSGCISRQVGAAVADKNYSIKSVGWNDVAKGQTPCVLRDVESLLTGGDSNSFSDFEQKSTELKGHLAKQYKNRNSLRTTEGLRCPYCFKDAYNSIKKKDNQVHTRSLHAEENAFLQLAKFGSSGIEHGILYTTASPCELCSKKASQLGIREVVYVDPYPGISSSHVLAYGPADDRPKLRLFNGAVGHAYHRLYDPILAIKDEYKARLAEEPQLPLPLATTI